MQAALARLETLLRQYGHAYEANLAGIVSRQYADDPAAACRLLNNDEWWGDGDAVCAIDLAIEGGFSAQARKDGRQLRQALIEIFSTMLAYGEHHEAGELTVSQFRKWLESNI